jgi:hypothetical protein
MGPYVGIRSKIVIMIPNVFWSEFFSDHACRNLEVVFFYYVYLMPNRHQHNEIQLCYLKTYRHTQNVKQEIYLDEFRYGSCTLFLRYAFI